MRKFPQPFDELRIKEDSLYEIRVIQGETVYGMDKLKDISIDQALFDGAGPQLGGVYSCRCSVKLMVETSNWPRAASFEVQARIASADKSQHSEWFSFGTYYTDQRYADTFGNLTIKAYDGMLALEQTWIDKVAEIPSQWPITAKAACDLIEEALGVQFDSRTVLDNTIPFIGLNSTQTTEDIEISEDEMKDAIKDAFRMTTARDTLATIAAGMGGNWHITPEGKLRLVPLLPPPDDVRAIAGIAIAGVSIVGDTSISDTDRHKFINLGMKVKDLDIGSVAGGVTTIELTNSNGTVAKMSNGDGYTIKGNCEFANTAVAELCYNNVYGFTYSAFTATGARLNPAAELGDFVEIAGNQYQIYSIHWKIGPYIAADISAPYEEAVEHEYTISNKSAKALQKAMGYTDRQVRGAYSYINQTANSIKLGVAETYYTKDDIDTTLENYSPTATIINNFYNKEEINAKETARMAEINTTTGGITAAIASLQKSTDGKIDEIISYVYFSDNVKLIKDPQHPDIVSTVTAVVVGKTGKDNRTSVRITNDGIYLCYDDTAVSSWDQNEQLSPKALRVPVGGKLTIGSILFQPRSSGNMSLMWVGQNNGN